MGGGNTEMTKVTSFKKNEFYLFIFGCVRPLLLSGLSSMAGSRGHSPPACAGFSLWRLLSFCGGFSPCGDGLWATGAFVIVAPRLQSTGSVAAAHRLSCGAGCGIPPDQGSNLCLLHWQVISFTTEPPGKP